MQQTTQASDYSLTNYIGGCISGNYDVLHGISESKPYVKALVTFIISVLASFLVSIFSIYIQFKTLISSNLASLGIPAEVVQHIPSNFSLFLELQMPVVLIMLGAAVGVWFAFIFTSFLMAKLFKGQGKFTDVFLFNLFLFALLPPFIFFSSFFFMSSAIAMYLSFVVVLILLLICFRAEYKGIKTLHFLTTGRAILSLMISGLILAVILGLILI